MAFFFLVWIFYGCLSVYYQKQPPEVYEKLLLRISQYSQETLMLESLFNKVAGLIGPATLLKSDANTGGFLWV